MQENDLQKVLDELWNQLDVETQASGELQPTCFFNAYHEAAVDNGDCPDLTHTPVLKESVSRPYQVDGYALDTERGELHLVVCHMRTDRQLQTVNKDGIDQLFRRAERLFDNALLPDFVNKLEETSPAFEVAYPIFTHGSKVSRVRLLIFTNARLSTKRKSVESKEKDGRTFTYNVIDLSRFAEIQESRSGTEPLTIDLTELHNSGLPALAAHSGGNAYESYLVAMPGELLAHIYGLYGARLLEQNVRTFLQARTKVNKGIINTISKSPEMFFAYNNGLTVTASGVEATSDDHGVTVIKAIKNMQIVNGGQTTASILYAKDRNKADLSEVFVQMKLSVVDPEHVEDLVPLISRYANTQNKVNEADFFASHPFHVEMEKISRRLSTPMKAGALSASKWFYERARGQYKDKLAYGTAAQRRKFETEFPRDQVVTKTDLAKYELSFRCEPHAVSQGAQKCFLSFAAWVGNEWERDPAQFNEGWFKRAVAKTIVFRTCDKRIGSSDWYRENRGYKAQIVTYTVAWLVNWAYQKNKAIDLDAIWKRQEVPEELAEALDRVAWSVAERIKDAPPEVKNISEYCKQQACWKRISNVEIELPESTDRMLVSLEEVKNRNREDKEVKKIDNEIDLDRLLVAMSREMEDVLDFARKNHILTPASNNALNKAQRGRFNLTAREKAAVRELFSKMRDLDYEFPQPDAAE